MSYPSEVILNIALHSTIEEIEKLSKLNQQFLALCSDVHFWKLKYQKDGLLMTSIQVSVAAWIRDYKVTRKVMDLLWLTQKQSEILDQQFDILLNVTSFDDRWNDIDVFEDVYLYDIDIIKNVPFPKPWKDLIDTAFVESFTHYIITIRPSGTHYTLYLEIYDDFYQGLETLENISIEEVINIVKYLMLYQSQNLYISDQFDFTYAIDCVNYNRHPDIFGIVELRTDLMMKYSIDFTNYMRKLEC